MVYEESYTMKLKILAIALLILLMSPISYFQKSINGSFNQSIVEAAINTQNSQSAQMRYFGEPEGFKGSKTPYGNNVSAGHYVQANDAKIYYEIYGTGEPIFVFHGGGVGTPYELGALIDQLRKDHQVIAVSTRGHGRSEIGHTPLSYEQKANDMITVMRAVTKKPAAIIGFSDGAYTAYKVAAMYPESVDRVVAIGAGTLKKGFFSGEMNVADLEKLDKPFIEQQMKIMPEPERYQEFCTNYMRFWNQMEVGRDLLSMIKCPIQLIVGDEDDHAPVATVLEAHQLLPNSRLCVVPKAWHTVFLDNYPVTWDVINAFIQADKKTLVSSKKLATNDR
jgi:pimeloyl-ACP methyl ester carboxylesterase